MRHTVSVLVAMLALAAGGAAGHAQSVDATLGKSFSLRVGESAQIEAEALQIVFEDVAEDSRCPKGEQCVWEGDATVRVSVQKAPGPKEPRELHTSAKGEAAAGYLGYEVRLVRLDPYPVSGKTVARGDYLATLEVTRGSSAAPDR